MGQSSQGVASPSAKSPRHAPVGWLLPVVDLATSTALLASFVAAASSRLGQGGTALAQWSVRFALGALALSGVASASVCASKRSRERDSLAERCVQLATVFVAYAATRIAIDPYDPLPLRVVALLALVTAWTSWRSWARRGHQDLQMDPSSPSSTVPVTRDDDGLAPNDQAGAEEHAIASPSRTVGAVGMVAAAVVGVAFAGPVDLDSHTETLPPRDQGLPAAQQEPRTPEAPPRLPLAIDDPEIDPSVLQGLHFTDVSTSAGLIESQIVPEFGSQSIVPRGAAVVDYDADGWPDIFLPRDGADDVLYRNRGDGTFTDVTSKVGLARAGLPQRSASATWADINSDGRPDLFLVSAEGARPRLLLSSTDGSFTDATDRSGLGAIAEEVGNNRFGSAFGDFDRDGDLDLVSLNYGGPTDSHNWVGELCEVRDLVGAPDISVPGQDQSRIWVNDGSGRFSDQTSRLLPELAEPIGYTPIFADIDDDGWPDLLITGDYCTSRVFHNNRGIGFTDITNRMGVGTDENGMGSAVEDFDGDGRLDWFVTSISYPPHVNDCERAAFTYAGCTGNRLWLNEGDGRWRDATDAYGVRNAKWGWGTAASDLDNDGDLDLLAVNGYREPETPETRRTAFRDYVAENQTRLWLNTGDLPLVQAAQQAGLTARGQGRSAITFDYDRDGDLDLLISRSDTTPVLYRNDLPTGTAWLKIALDDAGTQNRQGIGARVEVRASSNGPIQITEIRASGNYGGSGLPTAHFGFGQGTTSVAEILVHWPDGRRTTKLVDIATNQELTIAPDD